MKWLDDLWVKTKRIASLYTGTFIVVMLLNQLLFFGLCLNPICLIAAMPHVLLITVFLGTLINKISKSSDVEKPPKKSGKGPSEVVTAENKGNDGSFIDRMVNAAISFEKTTKALEQKAGAYQLECENLNRKKLVEINKQKLAELRALAKVSFPKNEAQDKSKAGSTAYKKEYISLVKERHESFVNDLITPINTPVEKESKEGSLTFSSTNDSIDLKMHHAVQRAKGKHCVRVKYRLRESIVKHKEKIKVENEGPKSSAELLSTSMLCMLNGIKNRHVFFKHLAECGLVFFKDKKYYLTNKGKQFGGMYRENEKNERWIVWSNNALNDVIFNFKLPLLERVNISYLMHITHIANLQGILSKGLLPHNNKAQKVDISNGLVNARRAKKEPIYKYSVHDYVPFYFNVKNAMLFQVQKEFGAEVIILSFRKEIIASPKVIFSRGNASSRSTTFTSDINELAFFNWSKVFSLNWSQNGAIDLELKSIMMSECLVYEKVAINNLHCIYCQNVSVQRRVKKLCEDNKIGIDVVVDSKLFF